MGSSSLKPTRNPKQQQQQKQNKKLCPTSELYGMS